MSQQPSLFDESVTPFGRRLIPLDPATCPHPGWQPSMTVWPGETHERMTATCECCGHVRGRWPREFIK